MYIGLSVGELREAEPIRNPSQDIDLTHSFSSLLDRLSVYVSDGVLQNHSIVRFVLI